MPPEVERASFLSAIASPATRKGCRKHWPGLNAHAFEQLGEAPVAVEEIETRIVRDGWQPARTFGEGFIEPAERLIALAQPNMDDREVVCAHVRAWRAFVKLSEDSTRLG